MNNFLKPNLSTKAKTNPRQIYFYDQSMNQNDPISQPNQILDLLILGP